MFNFTSVQMNNGNVFSEEKIRELTEFIINKFSIEKLSCEEAKIILSNVNDLIGEYSIVQPITDL